MRNYLAACLRRQAQTGKKAKKLTILTVVLFLSLLLSACGVKAPLMNELSGDNNYHYRNADLGFSLVLPSDFIYYQTQRKAVPGATELAIFVPTADTAYPEEVSGYAKPISVRVYQDVNWGQLTDQEKTGLVEVGEKDNRVYAISFWQQAPKDWLDKWNQDVKDKIINGFKIE